MRLLKPNTRITIHSTKCFRILCRLSVLVFNVSLISVFVYLTTIFGNMIFSADIHHADITDQKVEWFSNSNGTLCYLVNGKEPQQEIPFSKFVYPMDINMREVVEDVKKFGKSPYEPINLYPYDFINNPIQSKIGIFKDVQLLFLIKSAVHHFNRRQVIRQTWGNESLFKNHNRGSIKRIFLIGLPKPHEYWLQNMIDDESSKFYDIVQMSFYDNYYNNTLKTMGGLNWAVQYCYNTKFVMIVDDDFLINTKSLLNYLPTVQNISNFFIGNLFEFPSPVRTNSKWTISLNRYPFDKYPSFVSAGATLMSMDMATDLQIAMQYTKTFIFDDVFLAIVNYKLNVTPLGDERFTIDKISYRHPMFKKRLAIHGFENTEELKKAWSVLYYGEKHDDRNFDLFKNIFVVLVFIFIFFKTRIT